MLGTQIATHWEPPDPHGIPALLLQCFWMTLRILRAHLTAGTHPSLLRLACQGHFVSFLLAQGNDGVAQICPHQPVKKPNIVVM